MADYAIYNKDDELLFVGNTKECCEFLECNANSFYSLYSKFTKKIILNPKFKIYKIEEEY